MKSKSPIVSLCLAFLAGFSAQVVSAGSATWVGQVASDWRNVSNWNPAAIPNGPGDTATFPQGANSLSLPLIASPIELDSLIYDAGCPSFFTIEVDGLLTISGAGIINNSGSTKPIYVKPYPAGEIDFRGNAAAGDANCVIGVVLGRSVRFFDNSSAGGAIFGVDPGFPGQEGSLLEFNDNSIGGTASIRVTGKGTLSVYNHEPPGVTIGSLDGSGNVLLGAAGGPDTGRNLTVGTNDLSSNFSGTIDDAGKGGSLTKLGAGQLALIGPSTYTGATLVTNGTLVVKNKRGSGTGTGAVSVTRRGTLSGSGTIAGPLTLSRGVDQGARLEPGLGNGVAATLVIQSALTFARGSRYAPALYATSQTADKAQANGVTIASGTRITVSSHENTILPEGAVIEVMNNTAMTPISGTFDNLTDGGTVFVGNNRFQANYEGGDGNDLTLTVIP